MKINFMTNKTIKKNKKYKVYCNIYYCCSR